ncbi:hypothetical protein XA39_15775 [Acinetobacter tandoii]|nr:hypothetical protein XA39_15775 [Acinetobacter tandoii]
MSSFNKIENSDILLHSSIKYCNDAAYLSLHFFNAGTITIKSNSLLTVGESSISLYIDNDHKTIKIDEKCRKQIQKLQTLFKDACAYELKISLCKKSFANITE